MLSGDYQNCAFLGQFSPFNLEANEWRYVLTKTSKINFFEVKSVSESIFERFRKSTIRENFNLKRDSQMKKTYLNQGCNFLQQHNEVRESCSQIPSVMSKQWLRTRSKTWMQLKMFKFFLVSANHKKKSGNSAATDEQVQ